MRNLLRHTWHIPRNAIALLITGYQRTLSPDHGPLKGLHPYGYCRHSPTCSQYAKEVIHARGALIGGFKAVRRVLSCHPWAKLSDAKIREIAQKA
jgi:uncharacterized protein